jgi:hypothetical protein
MLSAHLLYRLSHATRLPLVCALAPAVLAFHPLTCARRPLLLPTLPAGRVRWCMMARSRLPFVSSSEPSMRFEAISTYKFDSRSGKIYEHSVDRIIPPESPVARWIEAFVNFHGVGPRVPARQPSGIPVPGGGGGWGGEL